MRQSCTDAHYQHSMALKAHKRGPAEKGLLPLVRPLAGVLLAKRKDAELRPEDPRPP